MTRPVGYRILVKLLQDETTTKSSKLVIPDSVTAKEQRGTEAGLVVALGPAVGKQLGWEEGEIKPGDVVYFIRYAGKDLTDPVTAEKWRFLNDEDVFGVEDDPTKIAQLTPVKEVLKV